MTWPSCEHSLELVFEQADEAAARSSTPCCSAHLLWALLIIRNPGQRVFADRGLEPKAIVEQLAAMPVPEAPSIMNQIRDRSLQIAKSCGSSEVGALHLVIVLSTMKESAAYQIIR
ncbi:MAG: Clp protease N-terminal domain-containing protein, partial [Pseudomonadota bacterium]